MQRLRSRLSGSALSVGVVVVLAAGGGYAFAAGSTNVINACANKLSGALRVSTHCTSKETALSWNRVGPPGPAGPGAKLFVFNNSSPTTSGNVKKVGTVGPWTLYGSCGIDNSGSVYSTMEFIGPALTVDDTLLNVTNAIPGGTTANPPLIRTRAVPASNLSSPNYVGQAISGGNGSGSGAETDTSVTTTWISSKGRFLNNVVLTAQSVGNGNGINACHWSDAVTPLG